jgi:hypothetical protein
MNASGDTILFQEGRLALFEFEGLRVCNYRGQSLSDVKELLVWLPEGSAICTYRRAWFWGRKMYLTWMVLVATADPLSGQEWQFTVKEIGNTLGMTSAKQVQIAGAGEQLACMEKCNTETARWEWKTMGNKAEVERVLESC